MDSINSLKSAPRRVLTGIQSSGRPHLGNILGAILPALELNGYGKPRFFFIADLHSLTTLRSSVQRTQSVQSVAAGWLAFADDEVDDIVYRQSRIREVCELTWYLSCFTSYGLLARGHSFKEKVNDLDQVSGGLFTYPILMAEDILLYRATDVPVGKDQEQHLEMARAIARSFNSEYGQYFPIPQTVISETVMTVPGTDGRKMSKSYNNYIDIFERDKQLRKTIMRIKTSSQSVAEPKNPDQCIVFQCYSAIASEESVAQMRARYVEGGYGYGEAKEALYCAIRQRFERERERYWTLMDDPDALEERLQDGESRARAFAQETMAKVRPLVGFG